MDKSACYRPRVARAYARLYRPLRPAGRRRTFLDHLTARWWTRLDVAAYRHLGLSLGVKALGVDDVLLLRTRGRRTGQVREVLVAYVELDGTPVVCAANGGSDQSPAWFENMRGGRPVETEQGGRRTAVAPVLLEGAEREQAFEAVYRAFPHVRLYVTRTTRRFPLVRLDPLGDPARERRATGRWAVERNEDAAPQASASVDATVLGIP